MAHTPGPWTFRKVFPEGGPEFSIVADGKVYHICGCGAASHSHPGASFTVEEAHANARLISAAPDLFAALKGFLNQPETSEAYDAAMQAAEAAIAKAEGR